MHSRVKLKSRQNLDIWRLIISLTLFGTVISFFGEVSQIPILSLVGSLIFSVVLFFFIWKFSALLALTRRKGLRLLVNCGLIFMMAGFSAIVLAGGIHDFLLKGAGVSIDVISVRVAPLTEETFKVIGVGIAVLGLLRKKKPKNIFWVLIMGGLIVGFTFGFTETLANEVYREHFFERLLTSIPDHGLWTAVLAVGLWFPIIKYPNKWVGLTPFIYFSALLWHGLWNSAMLPEPLKWVALPAVVVLVLLAIVKRSGR